MIESKGFEIHFQPFSKRYYSSDTTYGIYTSQLLEESPNRDKMGLDDYFRQFTLVGSMPELLDGRTYVANVEEKTHKKFGLQYEVLSIYEKPLSTREDQLTFLKAILTAGQVGSLAKAYPSENLVDIIKNDSVDLDLVHGVGKITLEKIKDKIAENEKYMNAILEITAKYGISYKAVKRLSEKYGSPDIVIQKLNENPYILTEVDGYGFKKVDEIALQMGVDRKSENRIISCIEYVLDESANSGDCWIKRSKLITDVIKLLSLEIDDVDVILKDASEDSNFVFEDDKVYLKKYFDYEVGIAFHLRRLLSAKTEYSVSPEILEKTILEVEEKQGFKFTEEQLKAINLAVEKNVLVINGKAGTGKTSVIMGIVAVLKTIEGLEYATCALSGKASQRIQESTGLDAYTIHRLLGYNPNLGWAFDEDNPMGHDVNMQDEGSMVNSQLNYYLIRAIKDGAKFFIAGDTAQLEPIGVGNVLVDLLNSDIIPSVELTKVHRQAQKSGILSCANMVREGKAFVQKDDYEAKRLGELKDLYLYPYRNSDSVFKKIIALSKRYNGDIMDYQVIVPMKSRGELSTQNLNNELQKIFNRDPNDVEKAYKIERKHVTLIEGDKVILNGNNYDKEVFNGTLGIIEHIDLQANNGKGEIVIDFDSVGRVSLTKEEVKSVDLGYALTAHKTQGSQFKHVVFGLDFASYVLLNRQLVYTAMTRAKENLFMPVELKALLHAIDTNNSSKRNTFLCDLLK